MIDSPKATVETSLSKNSKPIEIPAQVSEMRMAPTLTENSRVDYNEQDNNISTDKVFVISKPQDKTNSIIENINQIRQGRRASGSCVRLKQNYERPLSRRNRAAIDKIISIQTERDTYRNNLEQSRSHRSKDSSRESYTRATSRRSKRNSINEMQIRKLETPNNEA